MNKNSVKINVMDMLKNEFCINLADNISLRKDIDKIFNKNKIEYLKAYKESSIYKSTLTNTYTADVASYAEKVIGIAEVCLKTEDYNDLLLLYKKGFKKIYNNTKNIKKVNMMRDVAKYITPGYKGTDEVISTLYMYNLLDKIEDFESEIHVLSQYIKDIHLLGNYDKTNFSKECVSAFIDEIKEMREYLGISKRSYTAEELIQTIVHTDYKRYNTSKILVPYEMAMDTLTIEKKGEIGKYVGSMEGLFKFLKVNSSEICRKVTFTSSDIDKMLLNYKYSKMFNTFEEKDRNSFLIYVIYISALNRVYGSLKDRYLKLVNEDYLVEVDSLEQKLNIAINEANSAKEKCREKEKCFNDKEKELLERIAVLEKENAKLKKELNENNAMKQEVIKLRNLVFETSNTDDEVAVTQEDLNVDVLNDKRVVILGGNQGWINNMKQILPKATFAGTESKNGRLDFINKDSIVFINTKMKHSFYYKIKDILEKVNADYFYVKSGTNINLSLFSMVKNIKLEL